MCYNYDFIANLKVLYKRTLGLYFVDSDLNVGGGNKRLF
jgi:hypothetical protein